MIHGGIPIITSMLTHFYADAVVISWAIKVRMLALFRAGQVLNGYAIIYSEMPDEVSDAVTTRTYSGT